MRLSDLTIGNTVWCAGLTDRRVRLWEMELNRFERYAGAVVVKAIGVPYKKGLGGVLVEATIDEWPRCKCQCGHVHIPDSAFEAGAEKWQRTIEFTVHHSSLSDFVEAQADHAARAFEMQELRRHWKTRLGNPQ